MAGQLRTMIFDADRIIGKREHLGIGEAKSFSRSPWRRHVAGTSLAIPAGIDEPHLLLHQRAAEHSAIALTEGWLMDVELVGIDLALHDILAETPGAGNEDHVAKTGFG